MEINAESDDRFEAAIGFDERSRAPWLVLPLGLVPAGFAVFVLVGVYERLATGSGWGNISTWSVLKYAPAIAVALYAAWFAIQAFYMFAEDLRPDRRAVDKLRKNAELWPLISVSRLSSAGIKHGFDKEALRNSPIPPSEIEVLNKVLERRLISWSDVETIKEISGASFKDIPFHALTLKTELGPARAIVWGGQRHIHGHGLILSPLLYSHWKAHSTASA